MTTGVEVHYNYNRHNTIKDPDVDWNMSGQDAMSNKANGSCYAMYTITLSKKIRCRSVIEAET